MLRHCDAGLSTKQMADELALTEGTVRNYLSSAIGKLDAGSRSEAARKAREKGWI